MSVAFEIALWAADAVVTLVAVGFFLLDMADKARALKEKAPWVERLLAKRSAFGFLLLMCLCGQIMLSFEIGEKEVPEQPDPPKVELRFPNREAMLALEDENKFLRRVNESPRQNRTSEVSSSKPALKLSLRQGFIAGDNSATRFIVNVSLQNTGAETSIADWKVQYKSATLILPAVWKAGE